MVDLDKVPYGREEHLLLELFDRITAQPSVFEDEYNGINDAFDYLNRSKAMEVVL